MGMSDVLTADVEVAGGVSVEVVEEEEDVLGFVVFEFDVQAIFDTDFHLDGIIAVGRHSIGVYPKVFLFHYFSNSSRYCCS